MESPGLHMSLPTRWDSKWFEVSVSKNTFHLLTRIDRRLPYDRKGRSFEAIDQRPILPVERDIFPFPDNRSPRHSLFDPIEFFGRNELEFQHRPALFWNPKNGARSWV